LDNLKFASSAFSSMPIRGNKGIHYANTTQKGHSKRATATKFGIEPKQLRDWISKKTELLNARLGIRRLHQGPPPKFPEFETALVFWIRERRAKGNVVTRYMVQMKAKEMVINGLTVFCLVTTYVTAAEQLSLSVCNMDETPLTFDLPNNNTIDNVGARTVSIRTTGHERSSFTVVLSCMADGSKLPPLVIFKLKNIPRGTFPQDVLVRANPPPDG
ncbi:11177_t:CDS:2, partial [Paraglomus occultum]